MSTYEPLDRTLATLFADEAAAAAPVDLADRILTATARLRPRPTWRARLDQAGRTNAPRSLVGLGGPPIPRAWLFVVLALALAATVAVTGALLLNRPPVLRGVFVSAGSLPTPATMALGRPDGQVLIFGGRVAAENGLGTLGASPESILLHDPTSGLSREIGTTPWSVSLAVPLADGRVLAIGLAPTTGGGGSGGQGDAVVVDVDRAQVTPLSLASRTLFGAGVQLLDGRVLLVGDGDGATEAELFDPVTGLFTPTGSTDRPMMQPTVTLLSDGRVLVVGEREGTAELYDPATGTFSQTGPMSGPHEDFTATRLADGRVAILGGWATKGTVVDHVFYPSEPVRLASSAEIFDPATNAFTQHGQMLTPRVYHFAVALPDGRVLIGGGSASLAADPGSGGIVEPVARQAEIFDPANGAFTATGLLQTARFGAGAVLLRDGRVLVVGTAPPLAFGSTAGPLDGSSMEVFE
jgi:hypothetical protein